MLTELFKQNFAVLKGIETQNNPIAVKKRNAAPPKAPAFSGALPPVQRPSEYRKMPEIRLFANPEARFPFLVRPAQNSGAEIVQVYFLSNLYSIFSSEDKILPRKRHI